MYTGHFEESLPHQMIGDALSHRLIRKVGIWVEGLQGVIREIFQVLVNGPLYFRVVLYTISQTGRCSVPPR
jgi:hypothetical protein